MGWPVFMLVVSVLAWRFSRQIGSFTGTSWRLKRPKGEDLAGAATKVKFFAGMGFVMAVLHSVLYLEDLWSPYTPRQTSQWLGYVVLPTALVVGSWCAASAKRRRSVLAGVVLLYAVVAAYQLAVDPPNDLNLQIILAALLTVAGPAAISFGVSKATLGRSRPIRTALGVTLTLALAVAYLGWAFLVYCYVGAECI